MSTGLVFITLPLALGTRRLDLQPEKHQPRRSSHNALGLRGCACAAGSVQPRSTQRSARTRLTSNAGLHALPGDTPALLAHGLQSGRRAKRQGARAVQRQAAGQTVLGPISCPI